MCKVDVVKLDGETICQVELDLGCSVGMLKFEIMKISHIPIAEQLLSYSDMMLSDADLLLTILGLIDVAEVTLSIFRRAVLLGTQSSLPHNYTSRPVLEHTCLNQLLSVGEIAIASSAEPISRTAVFYGRAGAGKSAMATWLVGHEELQAYFEQIVWLKFGQQLSEWKAIQQLGRLLGVLSHEEAFSDGVIGRPELEQRINGRLQGNRTLLVSDDVWTRDQLRAFNGLTASGGVLAHLMTTRNHQLAAEHSGYGEVEHITPMQNEEARMLLERVSGSTMNDSDASAVLKHCRGSPAILRSMATLCRLRGVHGALERVEQWKRSGNWTTRMPAASVCYVAITLEMTIDDLDS